MVLISNASSNFKRGGLTTRGGGNTVEMLWDGSTSSAPLNSFQNSVPESISPNKSKWQRFKDWIGDHSEGVGKVIGGVGGLAANIADTVITAKGGKPFLTKGLNDIKKQAAAFVDKNESSGFGKLVKGFSVMPKNDEKERVEEKKDSNGHVPVGYDRPKPYYINPSIGGRNYNQFSEAIQKEWERYRRSQMNQHELTDKEKRKAWKKWLKKRKGKKGKKDKDGKKKSKNPQHT